MVADERAEALAAMSGGAEVDLVQVRKALDDWLFEPPLSEITDPKQRLWRMLKGA